MDDTSISIHAPRVGSDLQTHVRFARSKVFQSTLPVWGATRTTAITRMRPLNFNPRSPCGERPYGASGMRSRESNFNPRSPCGERLFGEKYFSIAQKFQSTLPVWGATSAIAETARSDRHFNPRSPCGERRSAHIPPALGQPISIHAPRVGSDVHAV